MTDFLYPDAARLPHLVSDLCALFSHMPTVERVIVFGSLAGRDWDRWSDVDLIVVTSRQSHFEGVFKALCQAKPILHHSFFTSRTEGDGAYVLGNVFVGESVFHCLDLNFLSWEHYQAPASLKRFGTCRTLYGVNAAHITLETAIIPVAHPLGNDPVEKRINDAIHFAKKALKKVLRQNESREELQFRLNDLRTVTQNFPTDFVVSGGNIGCLAQTYIEMAESLVARN